MAENPSNFVRDWIGENVHADSSGAANRDAAVARMVERLTVASRDDPKFAPDLLRDLIRAAIEAPPIPGARP